MFFRHIVILLTSIAMLCLQTIFTQAHSQDNLKHNLVFVPSDEKFLKKDAVLVVGGAYTVAFSSVAAILSQGQTLPLLGEVRSEQHCTGTLIGKKYVLTAAHCLYESLERNNSSGELIDKTLIQKSELSVFWPDAGHFEIAKLIPHPNFHKDYRDDIGIIKLKRSVENIVPVKLPPSEIAFAQEGLLGVIAGYGRTSGSNDPMSFREIEWGVKKAGFIETSMCQQFTDFPPGKIEDDKAICWLRNKELDTATTCYGDSGGPLFISIPRLRIEEISDDDLEEGYQRFFPPDVYIAGTTITGSDAKCDQNKDVGADARVSYYRGWLQKILPRNFAGTSASPLNRNILSSSKESIFGLSTDLGEVFSEEIVIDRTYPKLQVAAFGSSTKIAKPSGLSGELEPYDEVLSISLSLFSPEDPRIPVNECKVQTKAGLFQYCEIENPTVGSWVMQVTIDEFDAAATDKFEFKLQYIAQGSL